MKTPMSSRILAMLLVVVMVLGTIPTAALAADPVIGETAAETNQLSQTASPEETKAGETEPAGETQSSEETKSEDVTVPAATHAAETLAAANAAAPVYKRITTMEELTSGRYVIALDTGIALGVLDGKWVTAKADAVADNAVASDKGAVWYLAVEGSQVKLSDSNGTKVGPGSDKWENKEYSWTVSCEAGTFSFASEKGSISYNAGSKGFRVYNNDYPKAFCLYQSSVTDPIAPVTPPAPDPVPDAKPDESKIVSIQQAFDAAIGTECTIKGVVTAVDGQNIYLQDDTRGICLRLAKYSGDIKLGDTLIGSGKRAESKNGMPQVSNAVWMKSEGISLTPRAVTIGSLTKSDICSYVLIRNAEVTDFYDGKDHTYKNPNITIDDGTGSLQIYKAVVGKNADGAWAVQKGDRIDVYAAVDYFNKLQLKNTQADQIVPGGSTLDPIETIPEGAVSVKDAANLEMGAAATVVGQVVYKFGGWNRNGAFYVNDIILEDLIDGQIYGMAVYHLKGADQYHVGDVIQVSGNIDEYGGVKQLKVDSSAKITVLEAGLPAIPAQEITISQLGPDYLSEYVYIKDVEMGKLNIKGPTDVKDATGTTSIFKAAGLPSGKTEKDVIGIYAACSAYNGKYQLRNGGADDYELFSGNYEDLLPQAGDQVFIYNASSQGVLSVQNDNPDSPSLKNAEAVLENQVLTAKNGGVAFTVEKNGTYYRFHNDAFGYLCSKGTGNNAFYAKEATEDADWKLNPGKTGGFNMESRTAKFSGKHAQFMEYHSGGYKTYSMFKVKDYDIFKFVFYPVGSETVLTEGVVNQPQVEFMTSGDAFVGTDYKFAIDIKAVFGYQSSDITVSAGGVTLKENPDHSYTVPGNKISGAALTLEVSGKDQKSVSFGAFCEVKVLDEPVITDAVPAPNSQTLSEKRPVISAKVSNAGENPVVTMLLNDQEVKAVYQDSAVTYTPGADLADGKVTVKLTVKRADGKEVTKNWSFTVGEAQFQLYFGQLHSHTTYSDGAGSLETALSYVENLPEDANIDFVAFTDHSNYFDSKDAPIPEQGMYDMNLAPAESQKIWKNYRDTVAAFNAKQSDIIALAGFEMTWSGGPGHINTFNTPGIVSRNNATLNNKTNDAGMKAYYALLCQPEGAESTSQFNHPGNTFGTFSDFAHWDPLIDTRMHTVEVGNGEGQIGAGGYYPSYEYYTMALDKGWHVSPTNNQDNHKGKWGNANNARDVILTDDFTEQGIYNALKDYRVYATEDKNLELGYTVNGLMMGTIIPDEEVPSKLDIHVDVYDPDASDSVSKVEVIVNSGKTAHIWNDPDVLASGQLDCTLSPDYTYYYIKVTQADGDLAVTSPVWVGESLKLGISALTSETAIPVTGEKLTLKTTMFNGETADAAVKSLTYAIKGGEVLSVDNQEKKIAAGGNLDIIYELTPAEARVMTVTVTAVVLQDGKEYTFTKDITLDVQDAESLVYVGFDASHYNEYVSGNYKDSMGNFANIASKYNVRTVYLKTSEELIAACSNPKFKAIFLTAPSRRLAAAQKELLVYTAEELEAIKSFNDKGNTLILAGWSDHYEDFPEAFPSGLPADKHMAAVQNQILETIGSSLRINDDATYDDEHNGGQAWRLYFNTYGKHFLTDGVIYDAEHPHDRLYTEVFSHYGGASIQTTDGKIADTVTPLVYGHASTYSKDTDGDGLGGADKVMKFPYTEGDERLLVMASEQQEGKGLVIVSGAAFMSNFEVQVQKENMDNNAEKNYANYRICENLLDYINPAPVSSIAAAQAQTKPGYKFTVEGIVTSNASGYDKSTAFFDCIYIQDETAGINVFPVAGNYKVGDKVRITGVTSSYQGEQQLQMTEIELIDSGHEVKPRQITAEQLNDGSVLGQLVTIHGHVDSFEASNGLIQTVMVRDEAGQLARVFIDGYITTDLDVQNLKVGAEVSATGLASYDNTFKAPEGPFPRIRIRDRADVVCGKVDEGYIPGHVHDYIWTITKMPTDTLPGEMIGTCSCGQIVKREIPATGDIGKIEVESDQENALAGKLTTEDIVSKIILTEQERKAILAGEDLTVTLEVRDISDKVAKEDQTLVENALGQFKLGLYMDINIFKQIGKGEKNAMHQANGDIQISITVPENLRKENRTFSIIRVHDGKAEVLGCSYDAKSGMLTFATDRFSTYALVYADSSVPANPDRPHTGDTSNTGIYVTVIVAAAAVIGIVLVSRKKKSLKS